MSHYVRSRRRFGGARSLLLVAALTAGGAAALAGCGAANGTGTPAPDAPAPNPIITVAALHHAILGEPDAPPVWTYTCPPGYTRLGMTDTGNGVKVGVCAPS